MPEMQEILNKILLGNEFSFQEVGPASLATDRGRDAQHILDKCFDPTTNTLRVVMA